MVPVEPGVASASAIAPSVTSAPSAIVTAPPEPPPPPAPDGDPVPPEITTRFDAEPVWSMQAMWVLDPTAKPSHDDAWMMFWLATAVPAPTLNEHDTAVVPVLNAMTDVPAGNAASALEPVAVSVA